MEKKSKNKKSRFFHQAKVVQIEGGYTVYLDDKPVKTPRGHLQLLPSKSLADAIANEWRSQSLNIDPNTMPLCGFANSAIDRMKESRQRIINDILKYAMTDLLFYRSSGPDELVTRQNEQWQPLINWAEEKYGVKFRVTVGVLPIKQSDQMIEILRKKIQELDDMYLIALSSIIITTGSMIISLALAEGKIDVHQAFDLASLEEIFQNERWGTVQESEIRQKNLKKDVSSAALFLSLLGS